MHINLLTSLNACYGVWILPVTDFILAIFNIFKINGTVIYFISNEVMGIWKIFSSIAKNTCDTGLNIIVTLHCDYDDDGDVDDDNNS